MNNATNDNFIVWEFPQTPWQALRKRLTGKYQLHPIQPEMIRVDEHFWNTFDNTEAEITAYWLVRFAQSVKCWSSFNQERIDKFYKHSFQFNGLIGRGYIIEKEDGYRFTHEFICQCFLNNPKRTP